MMKEDVIRAFKVYENVETDTRMTKALNVKLKVILETKWHGLEKILQLCKIDRFDFVV